MHFFPQNLRCYFGLSFPQFVELRKYMKYVGLLETVILLWVCCSHCGDIISALLHTPILA